MREIKFRGRVKHTSKNYWVYGDLLSDIESELMYIRTVVNDGGNTIDTPPSTYQKDVWVHQKTIGQYTGLKDINGKEIYEDDILTYKYNKNQSDIMRSEIIYIKNLRELFHYHFDPVVGWGGSSIKIIGNIHENPELLNKEGG